MERTLEGSWEGIRDSISYFQARDWLRLRTSVSWDQGSRCWWCSLYFLLSFFMSRFKGHKFHLHCGNKTQTHADSFSMERTREREKESGKRNNNSLNPCGSNGGLRSREVPFHFKKQLIQENTVYLVWLSRLWDDERVECVVCFDDWMTLLYGFTLRQVGSGKPEFHLDQTTSRIARPTDSRLGMYIQINIHDKSSS